MRPSAIITIIVTVFVVFALYILFSTGMLVLNLGGNKSEEEVTLLETEKKCYNNECFLTEQDFYKAAESLRSVELDSRNLQKFIGNECLKQEEEDSRCTKEEHDTIVEEWESILAETFSAELTEKYKEDGHVPLVINHYGTYNLLNTERAEDVFYESTELVFKSASEAKIEFTARSVYIDFSDCTPMYPLGATYEFYPARYYLNDECNSYKEYPFVLIKEANKWVVDEFTLPY